MPISAQSSNEDFRIGIIRYKTEEKLKSTYAPMVKYIGERLNINATMHFVDEDKLAYELLQGNYDLGIFKPFSYLKSKVNFPEIEVFASQAVNGKDYYIGVVIAKKTSNINQLKDFKEKKFLFIKPTSTSGFRYPKGIFKEYDIDIESGFFNYDFSYDHDKAILALINNEVDGIAVSKSVLLKHKEINTDEYVILKEYKVPNHAYVLSPILDSITQHKIKTIILEAFRDPESKELFNNSLKITKWIEKDDDYYNYLRRYLRIIRVKPSVNSVLELKASAKSKLENKGDVISILQDEIIEELTASNRFAEDKKQSNNILEVKVVVSFVENNTFRYQVYFNNERISKSNIEEDQIISQLPKLVTASVLNFLTIEASLLTNGNDWFITFGIDDGLNNNNYKYYVEGENNTKTPLSPKLLTDLNTYFEPMSDLKEGQLVKVNYVNTEFSDSQIALTEIMGIEDFWKDNFWDKLGLIGGALIAITSAILGWYFNTRKKRRFKSMLTKTNQVLTNFYQERIKQDQNITELKEIFAKELENGSITENQFLILKHKISEIEAEMNEIAIRESEK